MNHRILSVYGSLALSVAQGGQQLPAVFKVGSCPWCMEAQRPRNRRRVVLETVHNIIALGPALCDRCLLDTLERRAHPWPIKEIEEDRQLQRVPPQGSQELLQAPRSVKGRRPRAHIQQLCCQRPYSGQSASIGCSRVPLVRGSQNRGAYQFLLR